jgi:hypothetical protein
VEAARRAAVEAAGSPAAERPLVRGMIDLGTWQALRDQGLGPEQAVEAVSGMLGGSVSAAPRSASGPRLRR